MVVEETSARRLGRLAVAHTQAALPNWPPGFRRCPMTKAEISGKCHRHLPGGGFLSALFFGSGEAEIQAALPILSAIRQKAQSAKTQNHHRPGRRFGNRRHRRLLSQRDVCEIARFTIRANDKLIDL